MAGTKAQGANGSGGGTSSWEAVSEIVQLGEDRHQDDGGGPVRKTTGVGLAQKRLDPQATRTSLLSPNSRAPHIPKGIRGNAHATSPPSTQKPRVFPGELPPAPPAHLILLLFRKI